MAEGIGHVKAKRKKGKERKLKWGWENNAEPLGILLGESVWGAH